MQHKKVLVYAFLANNVGDDLFVRLLCERYPQATFYISRQAVRSASLRALPNLKPSRRVTLAVKLTGLEAKLVNRGIRCALPFRIARLLSRRYPVGVYIAGSVFVQRGRRWAGGVRRQLQRTLLTRSYLIVSANFGPYADEGYRAAYAACFSRVTDVCFRDSYSKALFPALSNVRWAPDAAFTLPARERPARPVAMISVLLCSRAGRPEVLRRMEPAYEQKLFELACRLQERGLETCFAAFCADQRDDEVARRLEARCREAGFANASVLCYDGDLDALLDAFAACRCVVASRFHAMVIGWRLGKPVMPLCYDDKMRHALQDVPFFAGYDILHIERVDARAAADELLALPAPDCADICRRAQAQFAALDALLKEDRP